MSTVPERAVAGPGMIRAAWMALQTAVLVAAVLAILFDWAAESARWGLALVGWWMIGVALLGLQRAVAVAWMWEADLDAATTVAGGITMLVLLVVMVWRLA